MLHFYGSFFPQKLQSNLHLNSRNHQSQRENLLFCLSVPVFNGRVVHFTSGAQLHTIREKGFIRVQWLPLKLWL